MTDEDRSLCFFLTGYLHGMSVRDEMVDADDKRFLREASRLLKEFGESEDRLQRLIKSVRRFMRQPWLPNMAREKLMEMVKEAEEE